VQESNPPSRHSNDQIATNERQTSCPSTTSDDEGMLHCILVHPLEAYVCVVRACVRACIRGLVAKTKKACIPAVVAASSCRRCRGWAVFGVPQQNRQTKVQELIITVRKIASAAIQNGLEPVNADLNLRELGKLTIDMTLVVENSERDHFVDSAMFLAVVKNIHRHFIELECLFQVSLLVGTLQAKQMMDECRVVQEHG